MNLELDKISAYTPVYSTMYIYTCPESVCLIITMIGLWDIKLPMYLQMCRVYKYRFEYMTDFFISHLLHVHLEGNSVM